jgi:ubiquinone/menaquinone biosynthesis C-methylase UbiE
LGVERARLGRVLKELGHTVIGIDVTEALERAAATHPVPLPVTVADAARLPVRDDTVDLVVAFMSSRT